ncbi:MAG TPA: twin-arginine translocation pathway signal protein [Blastocatellia bacterium]|nr:twin-arginine translocation pathway signal protein [Blastocatellia bacterium]
MAKKKENHLLNRRDTLRLLGAAGATALLGGAPGQVTGSLGPIVQGASPPPGLAGSAHAPDCVVNPALTEGPYFVDEGLNRSDIRVDPSNDAVSEGALLRLNLSVVQVADDACIPVQGVQVDIWHCDALGIYSDIDPANTNPLPGPPPDVPPPTTPPPTGGMDVPNTVGQKFLRGYQITDRHGEVQFTTIYPGWYTGRTAHIHFKLRLFAGSESIYEFTSQFFFDDALTRQIYATTPYNTRAQAQDTDNSNDGIFLTGDGTQSAGNLILNLRPDRRGYKTSFKIGVTGVPDLCPLPQYRDRNHRP